MLLESEVELAESLESLETPKHRRMREAPESQSLKIPKIKQTASVF
jgi:hypothetical protein